MTGLITVIGICVLSAAASVFLKQYKPEYALVITAVCGCAVLLTVLSYAEDVFSELRDLFSVSGTDLSVFSIMLKCLGITVIVDFAAELCKDFGQSSLGSKILLSGKVAVVALCMPLIKSIINAAVELVG